MKLTKFSIIWSVIYIGFGLGLVFIPVQFMAMYGVTLDSDGALMTRSLGSALASLALLFWWNRSIPITEKSQRNILLSSFIYNLIITPVVLLATLNGVMNTMGWVPVALHIFLAVTFGYFAFKKGLKQLKTKVQWAKSLRTKCLGTS